MHAVMLVAEAGRAAIGIDRHAAAGIRAAGTAVIVNGLRLFAAILRRIAQRYRGQIKIAVLAHFALLRGQGGR